MQLFKTYPKEIDELYDQYKRKRALNEEQQEARYEKLCLEWTYNSNAIEGNSLTLSETAFYLREGLTSEGKPLVDYLEAGNHAEAIDWLFEVVRSKKPITEGFIKDLNALLHKGITECPARGQDGNIVMRTITPGVYKRQPNHVLTLSGEIYYYVDPLQVPGEMEKLVRLIAEQEKTMHPVELASLVYYEITRIHPFDDCNGRVARILLNLILMRAGHPPIVVKMEERRAYLEAFEKADKGDKKPFYLFSAEHVKQSLKDG
jgi:Fic family protein